MGDGNRPAGRAADCAMTVLKDKISRQISAGGPISIADYMTICLFDPEHGYYPPREPFGPAGDFTTAPEVSQMFGELVAVWLVEAWRQAGSPDGAVVAEIGPGRGTMIKDMARTITRLAPELAASGRFALIETSPRLRAVQRETLRNAGLDFAWHDSVEGLPAGPLFVVANELFDAVPIRQFVKTDAGWRERMVGLGEASALRFVIGPAGIDPALLPPDASSAPTGQIAEVAPAREALMLTIAEHLAREGGAGLFIDYGHLEPALGDTLQALRRHRYEDVLAAPGEADLTAHVDFAALAAVARGRGLHVRTATQGNFLLELGLLERAGRLGAGKDASVQERIRGEVERLAAPNEMGNLFKVLIVTSSPRGHSARAGAD